MRKLKRLTKIASVVSTSFIALSSVTAHAQDTNASGAASGEEAEEIIVTARRRDETSIAVPVNLTAVGGLELQRRAINNVDGLARVVPALIVGEGSGTVQGGIIAIRGISGSDSNPFGDQAVSFNIDGVAVGRASVRRMSEMDVAQIEVLKGPQALFFGKNSPAGIISVRSADPTSDLQARITAGYEFNADETRTDGFISGPLGETLGFRLAGYFSDMKGYVRNESPTSGTGVFPAAKRRAPDTSEYSARGTLKWDPTDDFSARAKFTYSKLTGTSSSATAQLVNCPLGAPQNRSIDDCKADDRTYVGDLGPNFRAADPRFGDGTTFLHQRQMLGSLELNYNLSDTVKLTSVTGFYDISVRNRANFTATYLETGALPAQILASFNFLDIRELTEELRLTSSFDGPVNFMIGGLYQDSHATNGSVTYRNAINPTYVNNYRLVQDGIAYSIFAQSMVMIVPQLEMSIGARYSYERKKLPSVRSGIIPVEIPSSTGNYKASFNNLSPEAALSYRPSPNLTIYGSYKEGFLSGGFNAGAANFAGNLRYDQQTTRGYEGGIKALLLEGALRLNFAAYNYKTLGMQVSVAVNGVVQELRNAGSVRTKGAEFDFNYRTPLPGLSLNGALAYNSGRYLDYQASCFRGESSTRCFTQTSRQTGATGLLQDLSGTQMVRAPKWTGNAGFSYETTIFAGLKAGASGNVSHSASYFTDTSSPAGSRQRAYELYDASVRVATEDDRYEIALIGRNLGDKHYFVRSTDSPFTGSAPGVLPGGGTLGDTIAAVNRGREIMLRFSVKFGG